MDSEHIESMRHQSTDDYKKMLVHQLTVSPGTNLYFEALKMTSRIAVIYSIFDQGCLIHADCCDDLSVAIKNLNANKPSSFRSLLGKRIFANEMGLNAVTGSQVFTTDREIRLDQYLRKNVSVSIVLCAGLTLSDIEEIKSAVLAQGHDLLSGVAA